LFHRDIRFDYRGGKGHRVLKKTGRFYYHCDWHASHYVKIMLDQIFGEDQFQRRLHLEKSG